MTTFNLDQLLTINDDAHTYTDDQPNAGVPQAIFAQDHFTGPELAMFDKAYCGTDLYKTFTVGGWEAGNFHRAVDQGPRVEGPVAYLNENATVLTAHRQSRRERILITEGDTLIIRGTAFAVSKDRYGFVKLTPAKALANA